MICDNGNVGNRAAQIARPTKRLSKRAGVERTGASAASTAWLLAPLLRSHCAIASVNPPFHAYGDGSSPKLTRASRMISAHDVNVWRKSLLVGLTRV